MKHLAVALALLVAACSTVSQKPIPDFSIETECRGITGTIYNDDAAEHVLNSISKLYAHNCFQDVISLGSWIRDLRRDKFYNVTAEMGELLTPEGTFSPYTLESYERSYLSVLIALSELNLGKDEAAQVEMRKSRDEEVALIYNYGGDPVVTLLQAAIWDRYDTGISRPYWKNLSENPGVAKEIAEFAARRLQDIDRKPSEKIKWRITGLGRLPELEWESQFGESNPYLITPKTSTPPACSSRQDAFIPTTSWTQKIGMKYSSAYHPLLLTKAVARTPIAVSYGILGSAAGITLAVGVCGIAAKGNNGGKACAESLKMGAYLIEKSVDFAGYTLKPDLRHWTNLPNGFEISRSLDGPEDPNSCVAIEQLLEEHMILLD